MLKAAAAEIDHLETAFRRMAQKDVLFENGGELSASFDVEVPAHHTSGLRSQWMILLLRMICNDDRSWTVKRLMRVVEKPTKLFALTIS